MYKHIVCIRTVILIFPFDFQSLRKQYFSNVGLENFQKIFQPIPLIHYNVIYIDYYQKNLRNHKYTKRRLSHYRN